MAKVQDVAKYGGRGRPWHQNFVEYMKFIVEHPAYRGMPDAFYEPGRIQWEAPSNRASGKFKDTHAKRRMWWAKRAEEIGISTSTDRWISRVAKKIHPTKRKPCKICGRELEIRYVYPQERFLKKVRALPFVQSSFSLPALEPVQSLVSRLASRYGNKALDAFPTLFGTGSGFPEGIEEWLTWLERVYIPSEPRLMSPGVMSNPPDRFDGFHSDNLCCRGIADKGRHKSNLKSYVTDRRVFEYWTAGDWVAADRLMGMLRQQYPEERCRHGHPGPCAADHIGPISLGFTHRPRFQLLCTGCNSAKNNRMYASDVKLLLADEDRGEDIVSWHSRPLWDRCKGLVRNDEHARRLSKLLRDNRHALMLALERIAQEGAYLFLVSLLELPRAKEDIEFIGLRIDSHLTVFDSIYRSARKTKYAIEQQARRCRIALRELTTYFEKQNRNAYVVSTEESDRSLAKVIRLLALRSRPTRGLDRRLRNIAGMPSGDADAAFKEVVPDLEVAIRKEPSFAPAQRALNDYMAQVGASLAGMWTNERYVRHLDEDGD